MTKTITITTTQDLRERMESRVDKKSGESLSARWNRDLEAYLYLMDYGTRQARRVLTRNEAQLILDSMNSTYRDLRFGGEIWVPSGLEIQIQDSCDMEDLDKKWSVNKEVLLDKLRSMDTLTRIALIDWVSQAWTNVSDEEGFDNALKGFRPDPEEAEASER